jgi:hypothetical protein
VGQQLFAALRTRHHKAFDTSVYDVEDYMHVLLTEIRRLSAQIKEDLQASQRNPYPGSASLSNVPPPEVVAQQLKSLWEADAEMRWKVVGDMEGFIDVLWTEVRRLEALTIQITA